MTIGRHLPSVLLGLAALVAPVRAQTLPLLETAPTKPDPAIRYVFYLHGQIIEREGRRPTHPRFGVYEYDDILRELAGSGAQIISEQRPPNTDVAAAARGISEQVRSLLDAGVPATRIAVVGFSKGGRIAIATSSILREPITYVFLAACNRGVFDDETHRVSGRVLSVYEESDDIGVSCEPLLERSPEVVESREVRISTGERHGAFYRPREEWLDETIRWIRQPVE
ncbi:MAG: alpha/beta hydrolase [Gemmatimonadota bacterium]|nr:alpha/beta hydrolase [Gemmatimonadota bacterium]MDH5759295.1 alpha/beta hydrolase [Gemmatimonadota bacterium]